ncbi:hypothetical protein OPT61_g5946 [Boeremia exigua]|uniref:Uncharacterized protein n=1 Tax=Boeremia exigua TaxID=749465 RepID=A0ACC2I8H2_9PLEO|nr:hypothetical protein OPT61_g5946 [Boeremia exigua]
MEHYTPDGTINPMLLTINPMALVAHDDMESAAALQPFVMIEDPIDHWIAGWRNAFPVNKALWYDLCPEEAQAALRADGPIRTTKSANPLSWRGACVCDQSSPGANGLYHGSLLWP